MTYLVAKPEVFWTPLTGFVRLVFISPFVKKDESVDGFSVCVSRASALLSDVVD